MTKARIMTKEEKQLLLKDLCARLPYGVKVKNVKMGFDIDDLNYDVKEIKTLIEEYDIKPYLRPMSSMTEEEKREYEDTCSDCYETLETFDWFNANHFNYRLPPHLFIKAPEGMYKQ